MRTMFWPEIKTRASLFPVNNRLLREGRGDLLHKKNKMSPPNLAIERGQIWGMGVRHTLFPVPTFGAHLAAAAGFPTPFSMTSGVFGLVAGPSNISRC